MPDYFIDYEKVLADLEAKRDALNDAINGIKKLLFVSAQALTDGTLRPMAGQIVEGQEIVSDTFFSMSIPDAIEKYLRMMKKPQSIQEIADALERGGFVHTSQRFSNTVTTTLNRMAKADDPKLAKVKGEWGLTEWYPGFRKNKVIAARRDDDDETEGDRQDDEESSVTSAEVTPEQPSLPNEPEQPSTQSQTAA